MCVAAATFRQIACVGREETALQVALSSPPWATTAPPFGSTTAGSRSAGAAAAGGENQRWPQVSKAQHRRRVLTVDGQRGAPGDLAEGVRIRGDALVESAVPPAHVPQQQHVNVPAYVALRTVGWRRELRPPPGPEGVLLLTFTCLIVIREEGGFPLSWQWSSTVSDSLIPPFGDSTHILTAVEGSGREPSVQQEVEVEVVVVAAENWDSLVWTKGD